MKQFIRNLSLSLPQEKISKLKKKKKSLEAPTANTLRTLHFKKKKKTVFFMLQKCVNIHANFLIEFQNNTFGNICVVLCL